MDKRITKHLRSKDIDANGNPRLPSVDLIDYGEIALNYADGKETLIIKNEMEEIVSFSSDEQLQDKFQNLVEIYYDDLVDLRDNGKLVPGRHYRITDYECTTTQENTTTAGHQFDVIVVADSETTLNENARAIQHDGDTYFANSNLAAWKIKYCLDGDTSRFDWAGETSHHFHGVIYYMKDEFGNECPYDFKNILFRRYRATSNIHNNELNDEYVWFNGAPSGLSQNTESNNSGWMYTFSLPSVAGINEQNESVDVNWYDYNPIDMSLNTHKAQIDADGGGYAATPIVNCANNVIKEHMVSIWVDENQVATQSQYLNNIVIMGSVDWFENRVVYHNCAMNTFDTGCYDMSLYNVSCNNFGVNCFNNILGSNSSNNSFGYHCNDNILGVECYENEFMSECFGNTLTFSSRRNHFFEYCHNNILYNGIENIFGGNSYTNTVNGTNNHFDGECFGNSIGSDCKNNFIGHLCSNNHLSDKSCYNKLGGDCHNNQISGASNNIFGDKCNGNYIGELSDGTVFGNGCIDNIIGKNSEFNKFGNKCLENNLANNCKSNTFGNECTNNSFGDNELGYENVSYNVFGDACTHNTITYKDCCNNQFGINCSHNFLATTYTYKYNTLENGCSYLNIQGSEHDGEIRYIHIHMGVTGTADNQRLIEVDAERTSKLDVRTSGDETQTVIV